MTASVPRKTWSVPSAAAQLAAPRSQLVDARLSETVVLRRCAQYRKVFRCAAVSYPADVLRMAAPAEWVQRYGVAVDAVDGVGLSLSLAEGVVSQRIIMHGSDQALPVLAHAAAAGTGRFVVSSQQQVSALAGTARNRRRVLVDVTDPDAEELAAAVISGVGLDMIGVHRRLHRAEDGCAAVRATIAAMRRVARRYNVIPARLSLGDVAEANWGCAPDDLAAVSRAVDDAVEDGCIASRFPSPAVNIAPSYLALTPAS